MAIGENLELRDVGAAVVGHLKVDRPGGALASAGFAAGMVRVKESVFAPAGALDEEPHPATAAIIPAAASGGGIARVGWLTLPWGCLTGWRPTGLPPGRAV